MPTLAALGSAEKRGIRRGSRPPSRPCGVQFSDDVTRGQRPDAAPARSPILAARDFAPAWTPPCWDLRQFRQPPGAEILKGIAQIAQERMRGSPPAALTAKANWRPSWGPSQKQGAAEDVMRSVLSAVNLRIGRMIERYDIDAASLLSGRSAPACGHHEAADHQPEADQEVPVADIRDREGGGGDVERHNP